MVRVAVTPTVVVRAVAGRSTTVSFTLIQVLRQGEEFLIQLLPVLWEQLETIFSNYRLGGIMLLFIFIF